MKVVNGDTSWVCEKRYSDFLILDEVRCQSTTQSFKFSDSSLTGIEVKVLVNDCAKASWEEIVLQLRRRICK